MSDTQLLAQQEGQLSASVLSAEALGGDDRQQIEQFVSYHVQQILTTEDPAEISDSRQRILDPLRNREITLPPAHAALSDDLARELQAVLQRDTLHVRITALLIVGEFSSSLDEAVDLVVDSLEHAAPGVRYLAADTIIKLSGTDDDEDESPLTDTQQNTLLVPLTQAMADESEDLVLERMYEAAGALTVPEARQVLLNALNARVNSYTGGLTDSLRTDQRGIQSLERSLAYDKAENRNVDNALRQLTIIAARLLDVVSRELQEGEVSEELTPLAVTTVQSVEDIFTLAMTHFDPTGDSGRPLAEPASEGEFDDLRLNVLEWIGTEDDPGLLTESAINLEYAQIHGGE
ncbi:MAG: hypothetical protein WD294_01990 [Phycisphaeraceae bacterium]